MADGSATGEACEVVRADTADLRAFTDAGESHVTSLRSVFDQVSAARSRVGSALGVAGLPAGRVARLDGGLDPLAELIAESSLTNAFAAGVADALAEASAQGVTGLIPADMIDRSLVVAGLDGLGRNHSQADDEELLERLAIRAELAGIVDTGSDLDWSLGSSRSSLEVEAERVRMIGLALESWLDDLGGADPDRRALAAEVMVDLGIDLQAGLGSDPTSLHVSADSAAATMLVTQGLASWVGDRGALVDRLAERRAALSLLVDALDLDQAGAHLNPHADPFGAGFDPWADANQPSVRQALLIGLVEGSMAADGTISTGGQALVDDVLDRYPRVVRSTDGVRVALARALAAPNYGLDDRAWEAAAALDDLGARLELGGLSPETGEALWREREILVEILAGGDPGTALLIGEALTLGLPGAEVLRLAHFGTDPGRTDDRVRRLRVVYDTNPWGDPVPVDQLDPDGWAAALDPAAARSLAVELSALQGIQLARFGAGRPQPEPELTDGQVDLVARYAEVAPWLHHRFAWGWPGGTEAAVAHLAGLSDGERRRILGEVPEGFDRLLVELSDPDNRDVWRLLAGASSNDRFLGPGGEFRAAGGDRVGPGDAEALLVQLALHRELGPYHDLIDGLRGDGSHGEVDGVLHEDEVARWLEAAADDPTIPPALIDRVRLGTGYGVGHDTFGWDEIAAIIGVVGLAAAATATIVFSGGTATPLWVQGALVGLAVAEGVAAWQAGDGVGAALAGTGAVADLVTAARLIRLARLDPTPARYAELQALARGSSLPELNALAEATAGLPRSQFLTRFETILSQRGYDPFLDRIAHRTLDEQLDVLRHIEQIDEVFVPYGRTDPRAGHAAGRHGPHIPDEDMFTRSHADGATRSRWRSWEDLEDAVDQAQTAVTDRASIARNGKGPASPISAAGWRRIERGELTVDDILDDPVHQALLKQRVTINGAAPDGGTRFHPDGTMTTDHGSHVVLELGADGRYHVVTAYPIPSGE